MPKSSKNYQQLSDELDELLSWFDDGKVNLDEAIEKHKKALILIKQMEDYLKKSKNTIKKITSDTEQ